jgi:hypothetical protein
VYQLFYLVKTPDISESIFLHRLRYYSSFSDFDFLPFLLAFKMAYQGRSIGRKRNLSNKSKVSFYPTRNLSTTRTRPPRIPSL